MVGSRDELNSIAKIVLLFWAMVNVQMDLLICVLYNKTANISDTLMSKGWLIIDEWNGRIKLVGPSWPNWNHSLNIFQNELRAVSSTSFRAGRHPQGRPSPSRLPYPSAAEWRWDSLKLKPDWSSTHFKMTWIWKMFRFSKRCMWNLHLSGLWRHVPKVSEKSVVRKCRQNIMYWCSLSFQMNGTFFYLFESSEFWCSVNHNLPNPLIKLSLF